MTRDDVARRQHRCRRVERPGATDERREAGIELPTTAQTTTTIAQHAQQDPEFQIWGIALGGGVLVVLAALVVLFLAALVSILGSPQGFPLKLVWIVIVLCLPFLGCLLWFAIGRGFARREAACAHGRSGRR